MIVQDESVGPYERVVWAQDEPSGLQAIVAVHSTALGPAVGGTRFYPYPDQVTAALDVLRLAEGMTLKSAAAGLDIGGGKAIIIGDPATDKTTELLLAYARVLESLKGLYYTAEDVGTSTEDMDLLRSLTPYALGVSVERGGCGDPSPYTSRGVVAAMRAAWEVSSDRPSLEGASVLVQGAGKVGAGVARLAAEQGALVMVSDVVPARATRLAEAIGGVEVLPEDTLRTECDILSPCALGGVVGQATVDRLRCSLICGAANNQLESEDASRALVARGIDYVPDFIANAGGIIAVADERHGFDEQRVIAAVDGIGETVHDLIEEAQVEGESALACATRRAARRLAMATA